MGRTPSTILLLLVVSALLAGCGKRADRGGSSGGGVQLTYWSAQNPQERILADQLVREWNAANPEIQVKVQPLPAGQSSEEVLLAAIVAGTTPDLCSNIWPGIVPSFVRAGGVLALDQFAGFDSLLQSRIPPEQQVQFRSSDGHFHQIPWKVNPVMMLYNVDIFREAGVEQPPRTYSEFFAAAEKIRADRNGDGRPDRWIGYRDLRPIWHERRFDFFTFYVAATGGRTLFERGEPAIDTAAATAVFDFFRTIYKEQFFPLTTFQASPILGGAIASEFTGSWQIGWLEANAPPDFHYAFTPIPVPDDHEGPVYTFGDFKNIVVFSSTRHPEEAWAFARYLVTREADLRLLEQTKQIPVRTGLLEDSLYASFFAANPHSRSFAESAPYAKGEDAVGSMQEMLDAIARQFEAAAVYGVVSPAEATRRALARIEVIHEWSR